MAIAVLANMLGVPARVMQVVLDIESGGRAFWEGRMVIRFENHIFWNGWGRHNPEKFNAHFEFNRLEKRWTGHKWRPEADGEWRLQHTGGLNGQPNEWAPFEFARQLNEDAAIRSISMGAPQIMGFNFAKIGFGSPVEMFNAMSSAEMVQLYSFAAFLANSPGCVEAMQRGDWLTFARIYNGSGQAHSYANLIRQRLQTEEGI